MGKELMVTKQDLQSAGITTQINQNDVVEIIASEKFETFMFGVRSLIKQGERIQDEKKHLFDAELKKFRQDLSTHKLLPLTDKDADESVTFDKVVNWSSMYLFNLTINEKDRGTFITKDDDYFKINYPNSKKSPSIKVTLNVSYYEKSTKEEIKKANIHGVIETKTSISFDRTITVKASRFDSIIEKTKHHNSLVDELVSKIPASGAISIDKFIRDARVKLNKNILKNAAPEFSKKLSEFFDVAI